MICFAPHVKKDVIPFSSDVGVTHVCGECDFCCDVSSFGVLVVVVYIHGIYTLGIYNYCITQTVYPPISHTVLWPGVNGPFYVWGFVV